VTASFPNVFLIIFSGSGCLFWKDLWHMLFLDKGLQDRRGRATEPFFVRDSIVLCIWSFL
jgi:hypothetical protein